MFGRGNPPSPEVFEYVETHFLGERQGSRFRQLWLAADFLAALPNRALIPRLPQAFAHCLRLSLGTITQAGEADRGRFKVLSREVIEARKRYEATRGLLESDQEQALSDLLRSTDELSQVTDEEPSEVVGLTNLIFEKTGARLVEMDPSPAVAFNRVRSALATKAHTSGTWDEVLELRDRALDELARMFSPPETHLEKLRTLAQVESPTAAQMDELMSSITNEHHLRFFLDELKGPQWLLAMGPRDFLAPSGQGSAWPVVALCKRFFKTDADMLADWLADAYNSWSEREVSVEAIAAAARELGESGHELLLRIVDEHPNDEGVRWQAFRAVEAASADSRLVTSIAGILLRPQGKE